MNKKQSLPYRNQDLEDFFVNVTSTYYSNYSSNGKLMTK